MYYNTTSDCVSLNRGSAGNNLSLLPSQVKSVYALFSPDPTRRYVVSTHLSIHLLKSLFLFIRTVQERVKEGSKILQQDNKRGEETSKLTMSLICGNQYSRTRIQGKLTMSGHKSSTNPKSNRSSERTVVCCSGAPIVQHYYQPIQLTGVYQSVR